MSALYLKIDGSAGVREQHCRN